MTLSETLPTLLRGRCIDIQNAELTLQSFSKTHTLTFSQPHTHESLSAFLGAIVEVKTESSPNTHFLKHIRVLTPNITPHRSMAMTEHLLNPRRIKGVRVRTQVESGIREFFLNQGFLETRTPLLVSSPGLEPHIRPFQVSSLAQDHGASRSRHCFLPTSPEFAMKRLLVGGLEKIFQITPAFRDEPKSHTHLPEFTMLEWYRAYADQAVIQKDTEELIHSLAMKCFGKPKITYQDQTIDVSLPWPRFKVQDLFQKYAEIDLVSCQSKKDLERECKRLGLETHKSETNETSTWPTSWDDLYFQIWLNHVEPKLPKNRAFFVTQYPASQAALSVIETDEAGVSWARRFEAYLGHLELANAFEELTDPKEQRERFIKDMNLRAEQYGETFPKSPLDEAFLSALEEGMPPSGGIALGVDRLVMVFADEPEIDYTFWLTF